MPEHDDDSLRDGVSSHISGFTGSAVQGRDFHNSTINFHPPADVPLPTPRQLPHDVVGFVNRVADLRRLSELAGPAATAQAAAPALLIVGTAGSGKSSLAIHWAHRTKERFPDGQLHVDLQGFGPADRLDPEHVLGSFLETLGLPARMIPAGTGDRAALFRSILSERRMLILLDNAGSADQVRPLLPASEGCVVLVTSRDRLSGLVARDGAARLTVGTFAEDDAIQLLRKTIDTSRRDDYEGDVAELARLCAQLPLALRIAAERAAARPLMPLAELIEALRDESSLWDALSSEDQAEAAAVRTVFAWSYKALSDPAARLFRVAGLLPGTDFSLYAVATAAGVEPRDVRRQLDELLGAHLIEQIGTERFRLHDLLRAFASDQAGHHDEPGDRATAVRRLLDWYLHTAAAVQQAAPFEQSSYQSPLNPQPDDVTVPGFPDYPQAIAWFRAERRNIVEAVRTAGAYGFDTHAWQIPAALSFVYAHNGYFDDWVLTAHLGLAAAQRCGSREGAAAMLATLGMAFRQTRRFGEASEYLHAALEIHRDAGNAHAEAWIQILIGKVHMGAGRLETAAATFDTAVKLCENHGFPLLIGYAIEGMGQVQISSGDRDAGLETFKNAWRMYQRAGELTGQFSVLLGAVDALLDAERTDEADDCAAEALDIAESLDNRLFQAQALTTLGRVRAATRRTNQALGPYQQAAAIQREIGDRVGEAQTLAATAAAYASLGRHQEAADFRHWAERLAHALGLPALLSSQ